MYTLITGKNLSKTEAAKFIANLNQQKQNHIGFCGTDAEEILDSIDEALTDVPFENSFVGVVEDGNLIGLFGFDADLADHSAELWGPFVDPAHSIEVAVSLWNKLVTIMPQTVKSVTIFSDIENKLASVFADRLAFDQKVNQYILSFSRDQLENLSAQVDQELTGPKKPAFIAMHDTVFKDTYYSGQEIIEQLTDTNRVFMVNDNKRLAGYVYVEAEPEYGEGSIEFIAVDPAFRGKGYGKQLLETAINWLFTFDSIKKIQLCVAADNKGAVALYRAAGFHVLHELHCFVKSM